MQTASRRLAGKMGTVDHKSQLVLSRFIKGPHSLELRIRWGGCGVVMAGSLLPLDPWRLSEAMWLDTITSLLQGSGKEEWWLATQPTHRYNLWWLL